MKGSEAVDASQAASPAVADVCLQDRLRLLALTAGAVLIHGYHGGAEDAEIYLPAVLKQLDPGLFPWNTPFFDSHAGMSLFSPLIADSVRLSHLPSETVLLLWHLVTIFGLLLACFRIARLCRGHGSLPHGSVRHVAILLHGGFHAGAGLRAGKALAGRGPLDCLHRGGPSPDGGLPVGAGRSVVAAEIGSPVGAVFHRYRGRTA